MPDHTVPSTRRHDLDALRSFAMLLGIALHAALAYIGPGWVVSDERTSAGLGAFVTAVHGFRMPLFFLLSGFFSAMLWRRHGLAHLASQRARRILLPLALACLTVLPAMWAVNGWAVSQGTEQIRKAAADLTPRERAPTPDIWTVAGYGDMEGLRAYTAGSELLDAPDPTLGVTPLGWTAIKDQPEAAEYLLGVGANPSARYRDGNTPLHTACFFGRAGVADHLLRAGADRSVVNATGERPADSMRHGRQTTEFIANLLKLPIDFEQVAAGRERIGQMIEDHEAARPTTPDASRGPAAGERADEGLIARLQNNVFFHHLWFLWFLCWLNAGLVLVALLAGLLPAVKLPPALFKAPLCLLWLVPVTLLTQFRMQMEGAAPGFGPDTSAGVIPVPHVLLYYATFFGFGALMHSARGPDSRLGRFWYLMLPIALALLPFGMMFGYQTEQAARIVPDESTRRWISALLQALYAWLMTFGLLGLFESLLAKDRPWVRYMSDSSYWLYLVHLPLIILGQTLLLRTDLPPLAEFALLTITVTAALLASYHVAVRYTPIGTMLNGKRARTKHATVEPTSGASG